MTSFPIGEYPELPLDVIESIQTRLYGPVPWIPSEDDLAGWTL